MQSSVCLSLLWPLHSLSQSLVLLIRSDFCFYLVHCFRRPSGLGSLGEFTSTISILLIPLLLLHPQTSKEDRQKKTEERTENTCQLEPMCPSRPENDRQNRQTIIDSWSPGVLRGLKSADEKDRQFPTAGAQVSLETRKSQTKRTDHTQQLEPRCSSRT